MNNSKKNQLRKVLIAGKINVEKYEEIKADIFAECGMSTKNTTDRMKWSNWINGKVVPGETYQKHINAVLKKNKLNPIYDEVTDN